jgi:PilZ domain-containing protein
MAGEQRKSARRRVQCRASLAKNEQAPRQDCIVYDISHAGARILIDREVELPSDFLLLLSRNVTRRCKLVWRKERQVGVRFRAVSIDG